MDLHLDLTSSMRRGGGSRRVRLAAALREAIRDGRLMPGARLPASRALCVRLGVSRGVVVDAYSQLAAEGYVQTHRGGGTVVAHTAASEHQPLARRAPEQAVLYDLNPFRPALSGFPRRAWLAALTRVMRSAPDEQLGYPHPAGVPELRVSLASYLGRVRGVRATPERVFVTGGLRQGMGLLWATLSANGARRVGIEQPGWSGVRETLLEADLEPVPLAVDTQGLTVAGLDRARLDAVCVTPAHQYPTGAVLTSERRTELVAWAQRSGGVVLEDDYDAEYRYDRQPVGSLQGLASEHVVYGGSTSKTLAPALRLGWLVLPELLCAPMAERARTGGAMPAALSQLAFADLIERGELDRHLRRQRRLYSRRRALLLEAIERQLPQLRVSGAAAGLYLFLELPDGVSEHAAFAAASARGIALEVGGGPRPSLVLGYANLADAAVNAAIDALAESLHSIMPT